MNPNEHDHPPSTAETGQPGDSGRPDPGKPGKGWLHSRLLRFHDYRASHREHPFLALTLAALVMLVGFVANDAYNGVKSMLWKETTDLTALATEQKQAFADLKADLGKISSSISEGDRAAYRSVRSAVASIENTNAALIQQLVLAKQENETLRNVAQRTAGVSGGYDFILAEGNGVRIDDSTVLGVSSVHNGYAIVNLTSASSDRAVKESLRNGESVAYVSAKGQACKLSLLSINNADVGTASFAVGCT